MDQEKKDYQKAVYGREAVGGEKEIGGMRQRYKELLEVQQKSEIILDEYLTDKSYLDYRKVERRKSLSTTSELIKMMKKPPSLDDAADIIEGNPNPMIDKVSHLLCACANCSLFFCLPCFLALFVGSKAVYFKLVIWF
jgi:hypothetical protein